MCKKIRSSGCSSIITFVTSNLKVNVKRFDVVAFVAASIVFGIGDDDTETVEVAKSTNLASGENRAVG